MREIRVSDFVFPGRFDGQPLHDLALLEVVKRLEPAQTAHGLRSTFRDWVGETTDFAGELAELAFGHVVGGVEGRYRRETAIDRRRALMDAWDAYLGRAATSRPLTCCPSPARLRGAAMASEGTRAKAPPVVAQGATAKPELRR